MQSSSWFSCCKNGCRCTGRLLGKDRILSASLPRLRVSVTGGKNEPPSCLQQRLTLLPLCLLCTASLWCFVVTGKTSALPWEVMSELLQNTLVTLGKAQVHWELHGRKKKKQQWQTYRLYQPKITTWKRWTGQVGRLRTPVRCFEGRTQITDLLWLMSAATCSQTSKIILMRLALLF